MNIELTNDEVDLLRQVLLTKEVTGIEFMQRYLPLLQKIDIAVIAMTNKPNVTLPQLEENENLTNT